MPERFYEAITRFLFVEDRPEKADIIFIPGSRHRELAARAAQLFHEGYAPLILPSGRGSILAGELPEKGRTEWDELWEELMLRGVPSSAVLREDEATFTWENAIFSRRVTEREGLCIRRAILCPQAFHARRALTYYRQQFPETEFLVCPAQTEGITASNWFLDPEKCRVVLGELERCGKQFGCMLPEHAPIGFKA